MLTPGTCFVSISRRITAPSLESLSGESPTSSGMAVASEGEGAFCMTFTGRISSMSFRFLEGATAK